MSDGICRETVKCSNAGNARKIRKNRDKSRENRDKSGAKFDDKNPIRLPRQDLMPKQRMAEISHLWAEWYLIYTLFTPFDLGRNTTLKERTKEMIKILFVCWDKRFQ